MRAMLAPMLLLATCCTVAALATPPSGPHLGWAPLADDLRQPVEVDRTRLRRDGGVAEVWIRVRGDPDTVAREFEAAGVDEDGVRRVRGSLHHSHHLWSFHCDDGSHALAVSAYYATDGTLIREFRPSQRAYWPVQAGTLGQRLLGLACGAGGDRPLADRDETSEPDAADGPSEPGEASRRAGEPGPAGAR